MVYKLEYVVLSDWSSVFFNLLVSFATWKITLHFRINSNSTLSNRAAKNLNVFVGHLLELPIEDMIRHKIQIRVLFPTECKASLCYDIVAFLYLFLFLCLERDVFSGDKIRWVAMMETT